MILSIIWKSILFTIFLIIISNGQPILNDLTTTTTITTIDDDDDSNERIKCETNDDCYRDSIIVGYHSDMKVICDPDLKICIIGLVTDDGNENNATTTINYDTVSSSLNTDNNPNVTMLSSTTKSMITTKKSDDDQTNDEIEEVPYFVWILLTIPFMSIIIVGILCAKRLQSNDQNIEANLNQSPINGLQVEELLTQREILNSIAASLKPPPSYEKATGQIPPSYETVLQMLQERHPSLFSSLQTASSPSLMMMMMMNDQNHKDSNHQTINSTSSTNSD
ncbi:uncharacterized protein LOC113799738 [Dermatophagoides pteronyssinus]|uniref:uncharacterized protein LOC113799738 n=1 Tax=Dermatophagoides pteronyssinus TaxID=6956 RepID=UPI003F66997B